MMQLSFVFKEKKKRPGKPLKKEYFRSNIRKNLLKLRASPLMIWGLPSLPYSDHNFFFLQECSSKVETTILPNKFRSIFRVVCLVSAL